MENMEDMENMEELREKKFAERAERIQNTISLFRKIACVLAVVIAATFMFFHARKDHNNYAGSQLVMAEVINVEPQPRFGLRFCLTPGHSFPPAKMHRRNPSGDCLQCNLNTKTNNCKKQQPAAYHCKQPGKRKPSVFFFLTKISGPFVNVN